jgi:two-component system chemotaxis response regulator CheB
MPVLDGLAATRQIMQETPTPIVLVTASASRENQRFAFDAFLAGVLAVVAKPTASPNDRAAVAELLRTVKSMAQVKVVRRWSPDRLKPPASIERPARPAPGTIEVIAIGASTGGPQVLQEILTRLPKSFRLPILIVQHIAPGFAEGLVTWLRPQCPVPIQLAVAGQRVTGPGIYVADSGRHLAVRGRAVTLTSDPPIAGHRPSATILFRSVAREYGPAAVGVLLTGMGDDGAAGLRDLKQAGGETIAQDEASSVVFGMPAVAIGLGVVDYIRPPAGIVSLLIEFDRSAGGDRSWT